MSISSFHLVKIPLGKAIKGLFFNLIDKNARGLMYAEYMTAMTLGSPILSPSRFLIREVAIFAQWEREEDLEYFLEKDKFGKLLNKGWHIRLGFMRAWGSIKGYQIPNKKETLDTPNSPVVAVTLARMKPFEIPRFLHWGRPVEKLVRDHSGTLLSLASFKFPNTISTFTIWKNQKEMESMVHGHSKMSQPKRHAKAMKERERRNFHFEFTTLRFKLLAEYGAWKGKSHFTQKRTS
ncbi:MAG: hypothetical protein CSA38_05330 [Flavobacteriales bacterium]|nr:MAG: hypothetical protein CSA38_05330 [Flavobacteriales bacterium]